MFLSLLMRFFEALVIPVARRKWIGAGKTDSELDNLTDTNTITTLSPEQRDEIKSGQIQGPEVH